MNHVKRCSLLFLALLAATAAAFAGNTGKIIGKVSDATTGEAIVGVNILVVGTQRGATTDLDGKYTIIGVPIGSYTVRASQVGYGTVNISDVKVGADATTPLNFKLTSSEVEVKGVTVTADQQLVNSLSTSSTQTVSSKSIESIPNVKNVEDVLKLQTGFVKQGNNLFLRGGRANEVQYLVDGIPSNSIVTNNGDLASTSANQELQKLYAGVQSGAIGGGQSGLAVSANAIQSVSVQTSGFDADYGNAQSGIINITTKSGSDRFTGSAQYRTDKMANTNQNEMYSSFSLGGPEPISKFLLPSLGVKIPGAITFFLSSDVSRADGPYNYAPNLYYNPLERKIEFNGLLGGLLNGFGFRFSDNQKNSFTFNSKLRYDPSGNDQFSYGYRASLTSRHDYLNSWKYRADSSSLSAGLNIQHNLSWIHFFNQNAFLKIILGKTESKDGNDVAGIKPSDYSPAWEKQDINNDGFNDLGTSQRWFKSQTNIWSFRLDFNSQVHPLHMLKTGVEFNYEEIRSTEILYPTVPHTNSDGDVIPLPDPDPLYSRGDYPGYGQYRWALNNYPNRGGAYVQDNIEFSGLNIHVGVRYDYFDIGKQVFDQNYIDAWRQAVESSQNAAFEPQWAELVKDANGKATNEFVRLKNGSTWYWYATHGNFSPRLAIGYPVTDRITFYFNYGHFLQYPERDNYFRDPYIIRKDNTLGNPDMKPKRTVSYEAGFEDQFNDEMAFTVHAFYKDIFDLDSFVKRGIEQLAINLDYASARGFELTFNQALTGNFSATITYSYQIAKGRASNPLASIYQPQFQLPRETRLDFDQNHTANLFMTYRVGPHEESKIFGLPLNNYGISLTWSFGSGFPYNGYDGGRTTARNVYLINSETKPYTSTVNLTMYKGLRILENVNVLATLDILNLFNRRNVVDIFSYTGRPNQYGDVGDPASGIVLPWYQAESNLLLPTSFEAPRQILLGVKLQWD